MKFANSKKRKKNPSKRTTPGKVLTRDAAPQNVNREGQKWEKTLDLQNKVHRKALNAKLLKRSSRKK